MLLADSIAIMAFDRAIVIVVGVDTYSPTPPIVERIKSSTHQFPTGYERIASAVLSKSKKNGEKSDTLETNQTFVFPPPISSCQFNCKIFFTMSDHRGLGVGRNSDGTGQTVSRYQVDIHSQSIELSQTRTAEYLWDP